jgi:hypothetical protein
MLAAIQTAVRTQLGAGAVVPKITTALTQRTDSGVIVLQPGGIGVAVGVPIIILLGADGAGSGPPTWQTVPRKGETVILDDRGRNGHILIAAGGNVPAGYFGSGGGNATVIAGAENLIVALGGNAASGSIGQSGADGGDGVCQGIGSGNDLYSEGGVGGSGGTGITGSAGARGIPIIGPAATPAGMGGLGGSGGNGGKAFVSGGDNSYGLARGGAGGIGGAGGAGGAGVPKGATGRPADGGDGGDYHTVLGANSVVDPASAGGSGGRSGGPPAVTGASGIKI